MDTMRRPRMARAWASSFLVGDSRRGAATEAPVPALPPRRGRLRSPRDRRRRRSHRRRRRFRRSRRPWSRRADSRRRSRRPRGSPRRGRHVPGTPRRSCRVHRMSDEPCAAPFVALSSLSIPHPPGVSMPGMCNLGTGANCACGQIAHTASGRAPFHRVTLCRRNDGLGYTWIYMRRRENGA